MSEILFARLDEMLTAVANLQAQISAIVPIDNANIIALSNLNATGGLLTQTAAATFTKRTMLGTAAQITVTNGDGVAGAPTISLPTAITLTGITLTGGAFVGPALGTPISGVATNLTGTAAGLTAGNVTTNANLTGDVTSSGNATTLTNAPVIAKVLTGYVSGAGVVAATDSILAAIQKLNGNDATNANLTGDVTSVGNATTLTNAPVIAKVLTGYVSGAGTISATDSILAAFQKINGNDLLKAPLASPALTGTPTAPTATIGTNTTQLATTAFVLANGAAAGVGSIDGLSGAFTTGGGLQSTSNVLSLTAARQVRPTYQSFTAGGTYTPTAGTLYARIRGVGGGGGGGGSGTGASAGGNGGTTVISATLTSISNATPAVFTETGHGLQAGQPLSFTTSGTLPTGLSLLTTYYVIAAGLAANTFEVALTPGGTAINTSSAGSGTHSIAWQATGGIGGGAGTGGTTAGGVGGTAIGALSNAIGQIGQSAYGNSTLSTNAGGLGGDSALFGGGGVSSSSGAAGPGIALSGGGASGGAVGATATAPGGGGGGGGSIDVIIPTSQATYTVVIGAAGTAGTVGTFNPGAAGSAGFMMIEEFHN